MLLTPDPDRPVELNGRRLLVLAEGSDVDVDDLVDPILRQLGIGTEPPPSS